MTAQTLNAELIRTFVEQYPADAAIALDGESAAGLAALLASQSTGRAALLLRHLNPEDAAQALTSLNENTALELLQAIDPGRAAALLARCDKEDRERLLGKAPPSLARELETLLSYPPDTAGHLMDARVLTFRPEQSVARVFERVRSVQDRRISDLFVTDEHGHLLGSVPLQSLVGSEPETRLESLTLPEPISVKPMDHRDDVVKLLEQFRLASLPVVDHEGMMVGVIRHHALVRAAKQDAVADLQAMVGANKEERALSSPWYAVRSRLPWLNINLVTAFLASAVVALFDATIAKFTALAVLLPVVAGQSGNTGAQALAVTSRGLALREIRPSHWWRVLRKEAVAGATNGIAVAIVTSGGVFVWSGSSGLAFVIGIAMVISMMLAGVAGAMIPILLTILGRDPATASSIILTTVTDIVGFFSFLGLATMLSHLLVGL